MYYNYLLALLINIHIFADALIFGSKEVSTISLFLCFIILGIKLIRNRICIKKDIFFILLSLQILISILSYFANLSTIQIELFIQGFMKFNLLFLLLYMFFLDKNIECLEKVLNLFIFIMVILSVLGILQFFSLLDIKGTRSYLTFGQGLNLDLIRATSYFDEPSAFAKYLLIGMFLVLFLKKAKTIFLLFVFSLFTSMSMGGFLTFLIFLLFIINKSTIKYLTILILISILLFVLNYDKFLLVSNLVMLRFETGSFGDYRVLAPIYTLEYLINHVYNFISGVGIGQIQNTLINSGLPENPNTTHCTFTDLFLELGIFGFLIYCYLLFIIFKLNKAFFGIVLGLSFFALGYRGPVFLLVGIVYIYLSKEKIIEKKILNYNG